MSPRGKAREGRTYVVRECELYKEEWDVLEREMRKANECDVDKFSTPQR